jgi:hypothetical protein
MDVMMTVSLNPERTYASPSINIQSDFSVSDIIGVILITAAQPERISEAGSKTEMILMALFM